MRTPSRAEWSPWQKEKIAVAKRSRLQPSPLSCPLHRPTIRSSGNKKANRRLSAQGRWPKRVSRRCENWAESKTNKRRIDAEEIAHSRKTEGP
jgi:hypothetical protein